MQVQVEIKKGKVITNNEKLKDFITSRDDGIYIISIDRVNPLTTTRDYQKAYFDKVDIAVDCTGNNRYTIHEEFKKHSGIDTTKDLSILEWRKLLMTFSWWAYNKFDCIV